MTSEARRYLYDSSFYDAQEDDSSRAARRVVPIARDLINPLSVLDVGCGVGTWLRAWQDIGVRDLLGVDGGYIDNGRLQVGSQHFDGQDLSKPLQLNRKFDLVMSLEVAEHLPISSAKVFVDSLVRHGDVIIFSAAIPGQPGLHHVNCQWPSWWAELFSKYGYHPSVALRSIIWNDAEIADYYRQNILIFANAEGFSRINVNPDRQLIDAVHPEIYAQRVLVPLRTVAAHRLRSHNLRTRLRSAARRV